MEATKGKGSRSERMKRFRTSEDAKEGSKNIFKRFPFGFYVLIAGGIWAIVEFVMAILYFF